MGVITLSNGDELTVPDTATPAEVERYRTQGEAFIANADKPAAPPADLAPGPVPVQDHNVLVHQAEDYAKSFVPPNDPYRAPIEWGSNVAQGVLDLANAVPNTVNAAKSLYDLHFGSGTGLVENQWPPWVDVPQVGTQTPGWEGTQEAGQITGASAPLITEGLPGIFAATVGMPLAVKAGRAIGNTVDNMTGNQDTHKWAKTGEAALPFLFGGARVLKNAPVGLPKIPLPLKTAAAAYAPSKAMEFMGAKIGLQAMDKLWGGKPRGAGADFNSMVKQTAIPLRLEDRQTRERR